MNLKSIRENYTNLLAAFSDAGIKLNESQKSNLDSFILSLESAVSEQRIKAIKMAKRITESKMQDEYKQVFESVMKHMQERMMLESKIRSRISTMKAIDKMSDKVDNYLDMYVESVCPKKVLVDYAKMKKLEQINESLRDVLVANDEAVEQKKERLEESYKKQKGKLETEVAKMQVKLNESMAKSQELKKKLEQYKAFALLESKTKDLPTFEARKLKKHFSKASAAQIEKNFDKVYENVKDVCKEAEKDAETALEAEVEKIVDDSEETDVKENDMLRNRPHNGHIDDPRGVISEGDDTENDAEEEDFETTETITYNENGDVELGEDDVIDESTMNRWCRFAE